MLSNFDQMLSIFGQLLSNFDQMLSNFGKICPIFDNLFVFANTLPTLAKFLASFILTFCQFFILTAGEFKFNQLKVLFSSRKTVKSFSKIGNFFRVFDNLCRVDCWWNKLISLRFTMRKSFS